MSCLDIIDIDLVDGDLKISGVPMRCPAWAVLDLTELWLEAEKRGRDRVVAGAGGVITNPRRRTITRVDLSLVMTGAVDRLGVEYANEWQGWKDNLAYLNANVIAPPALPATTRTALLTDPDGVTTTTAEIHVGRLEPRGHVGTASLYTLPIEIPLGVFA